MLTYHGKLTDVRQIYHPGYSPTYIQSPIQLFVEQLKRRLYIFPSSILYIHLVQSDLGATESPYCSTMQAWLVADAVIAGCNEHADKVNTAVAARMIFLVFID